MKEAGASEIVEHKLAERYVHAGQPLELYRRQRHAWHLDVFSPNPFERQAVGQHIHTTSLSWAEEERLLDYRLNGWRCDEFPVTACGSLADPTTFVSDAVTNFIT